MSNPLDSYHAPANPVEENRDWYEALAITCPMLADALMGSASLGKAGPVRPPLSFILSVKEGKLRFSLSSPDASRTYFGAIDDPCEPLAAAERCLAASAGEWVTKKTNFR